MGTLTNLQIGSIVLGLVEGVSTSISGLLVNLVNNNVYTAETITGDSIPVTAIGEAYQAGVTSMTIGNVLSLMSAQGIGTKSVKIGELSITKGMTEDSPQAWINLGMQQIKQIGEKISYYQTWD